MSIQGSLTSTVQTAAPLTRLMTKAGYRLYLVGGVVRDGFLGRSFEKGAADLDCTTDATPTEVLHIIAPVASVVWTQGQQFGTIGCMVDGQSFEITTHRADSYTSASRKPEVRFGSDIIEDLRRRDFTVNAIAVDCVDGRIIDPCGGRQDLDSKVLRTPLGPHISFTEDPLRMLRAARFIAGYNLKPLQSLTEAVVSLSDRLDIVAMERIRDELQKLLLLDNPVAGMDFLAHTGLLPRLLPEVTSLGGQDGSVEGSRFHATIANIVAAVKPELDLRWAALLAAVPTLQAVERLLAFRVPSALTKSVEGLLKGLELLKSSSHSKSDVRRLAHICGVDADRVVNLARTLATCRDSSHPQVVFQDYPLEKVDRFENTLRLLRQNENLECLASPLTGTQIMKVLGIPQGPQVGRALAFLQELAFDDGPLTIQEATTALLGWQGRQISQARKT